MAFVSQQSVRERSCVDLIGTVRKVRISKFSTPSSFYIQLIEEDGEYIGLEEDMEEYYSPKKTLTYLRQARCMQARDNFEFQLPKLKIRNLQQNMYVAVRFMSRWERARVENESRKVKLVDCGISFELNSLNERTGIYNLARKFLNLPSRGILVGLGGVIPFSSTGADWTSRACRLFKKFTRDSSLLAYFESLGMMKETLYIFLTSVDREGNHTHVNTILCGFNAAIVDHLGLHHPIWSEDVPCI